MHTPERTKNDISLSSLVQPRLLGVIFGILVAFAFFFWFTGSSEVDERQQSAIALCVREGTDRAECQRRVDQHHEACYDWAYTMGGSARGTTVTESFDLDVYRTCLKMGGEAYTNMRHEKSKKKLEERRERHRQQQQYMP